MKKFVKSIDSIYEISHNELKYGEKVHFSRTMHCLPQRLNWTLIEKKFECKIPEAREPRVKKKIFFLIFLFVLKFLQHSLISKTLNLAFEANSALSYQCGLFSHVLAHCAMWVAYLDPKVVRLEFAAKREPRALKAAPSCRRGDWVKVRRFTSL